MKIDLKNSLIIRELGTIIGKSRLSTVILKIVGATSQLDENFKPTGNLHEQFFFIYHIFMYMCIMFNIS